MTPCLIPGRSQSSRTTWILTDSMFLKDQPRTNWSLTLVTQETTSNGTTTPQGTLWAKLSNTFEYIKTQLSFGAASGRKYAEEQAEVAADRIKEGSTYATNRAGEAAQKAADRVKEEL